MPHHHMVLPHYMGKSREIDIENNNSENQTDISRQNSFSSQSPLQDIPLLLPQEADGLAVPNLDQENSLQANHNLLDHPNGTKVEALVPDEQINGSVGDLDFTDHQRNINLNMEEDSSMTVSDEWWENQEESYHNAAVHDCGEVGPRIACHCQVT